MRVASVLRLASTIFSAFVALCFLNRPRFWWQDAVCNHSPYILPLLICSMVFNARHLFTGRLTRVFAVVGTLASVYCIYTITSVVEPFFWYPRWSKTEPPFTDTLRVLFIDDCAVGQREAREILLANAPDVTVVVGAARASFLAAGANLTHRRDFDEREEISILTALDLQDRGVPNLGFNARPGGVVGLKLQSGATVDLGVVSLRPTTTRSEFERNRISARRLASYMRNSEATRLVVGSFYATPFSQLSSVFTSQARLRSLWYGKGIVKTYDMNHTFSRFTFSHGFVSRDIRPRRVERVEVPGCSRAGLSADLLVESPVPASKDYSPRESTIEELE